MVKDSTPQIIIPIIIERKNGVQRKRKNDLELN